MNTIWFDVTTILGWHRPAVGVIRTEAECAAHALQLASQGQNVRFCIFDFTGGYQEVSSEEVKASLDRIFGDRTEVVQHAAAPITSLAKQPLEARLKGYLFKTTNWIPVRLRSHLFLFLQIRKNSFFEAIAGARLLRSAVKSFLKPTLSRHAFSSSQTFAVASDNRKHPFGREDTYVSLGLDWDQKDLTYLFRVKKEVGLKIVLFCYDVIPVILPHLCVGDVASKFANYFTNVAWCADKVVCISECSRHDLQSLLSELGAPIPKMEVVKLGCHVQHVADTFISERISSVTEKPFILFVSTIERRKNHETLYRAYTKLIEKGVKNLPLLVFVGMPGWGINDFMLDLKLDPRTQKSVVMLNNVTDSELVTLYSKCWVSAFPSLYEGWGLPVAESLSFGKYCLASNAASIPEVGGNLLNYLEPWDVSAWATEIEFLLNNPEDLKAREEKIVTQYVPVSWPETAASVFRAARVLES
jgi:glycosyltransferase involved in cell wall biosynthesis